MRHITLLVAAATALTLAAAGVPARADDTTTTTTTTTRTDPQPGVTVGVPGIVGVHIGGDNREGCSTRQSTHTNDETGNSVTHTTTDCN